MSDLASLCNQLRESFGEALLDAAGVKWITSLLKEEVPEWDLLYYFSQVYINNEGWRI